MLLLSAFAPVRRPVIATLAALCLSFGLASAGRAAEAPASTAIGAGFQALSKGEFKRAAVQFAAASAAGAKTRTPRVLKAVALALAGEAEPALQALQEAASAGYWNIDELRGSPELAPVRQLSGWAALEQRVLTNATRYRAEHADPDKARLHTEDVARFWHVYDQLESSKDGAALLQQAYLEEGSAGLQDFIGQRIGSGQRLLKTIQTYPRYFAAIRANTLAIDRSEPAIRAGLSRLKAVYPAALFPDIYFVIGVLSSGGTSTDTGLLMGAEMYSLSATVPREELTPWLKASLQSGDQLPHIVLHELAHFQQTPPPGHTLLDEALKEGVADLLAELTTGKTANEPQRVYGLAHEAALWREFSEQRHGTDLSAWLYNGDNSKDRPADLGYFIGYRIAKAFYEQAADRPQALAQLLKFSDAEAILRASAYAERFAKP